MNQMIMDKLNEEIQRRVMNCMGMGVGQKSSGISSDELAKHLDHYFDDIVDGRREMPGSLCKLLCEVYTKCKDATGATREEVKQVEECESMSDFWEKMDDVRKAPATSKNERIKTHFPTATPEEMMVLKQLSTEKSFAEHAKSLGMTETTFKQILKRIA